MEYYIIIYIYYISVWGCKFSLIPTKSQQGFSKILPLRY